MFLIYLSYCYSFKDLKENGKGFANKKTNSLRSLQRTSEDVNDKYLQLKARYFSIKRPFIQAGKDQSSEFICASAVSLKYKVQDSMHHFILVK